MHEFLITIIEQIALGLELVGVIIVTWGAIKAISYLVHKEYSKEKHHKKREKFITLRHEFGLSLVLSLEFLLAADIIRTVISPTYDELGKVAILMAIRTILSFFLTREIKGK